MSYVKYREDDIRITEDRHVMSGRASKDNVLRQPVRYFDCKYCGMVFSSREDLHQHIRNAHNIVRPLFVINGKVVGNYCVIHHLDSAYIYLFGFNGPILINNTPLEIENDDEMEITLALRRELEKAPSTRITIQNVTVEIRLSTLSVRSHELVTAIIEQWEEEILRGKRLSDYPADQLQEGDRLFLDGMYNYYVACCAKKDKAKRYDDALAILSCFDNMYEIGNCVLKIISFRRNWLSRLKMLTVGQTDDFSIAMEYFERKSSDMKTPMEGKQIYIEENTKKSLDLIVLFQLGNYNGVRQKLREFQDIEDLDDLNLADQLNLLNARLAVLDGNTRKAEKYYEKIVTPAFLEEFRLYQKGMLRFDN